MLHDAASAVPTVPGSGPEKGLLEYSRANDVATFCYGTQSGGFRQQDSRSGALKHCTASC